MADAPVRLVPSPRSDTSAGDVDTTSEPVADIAALQRLLAWLSPAFPVGGFSYSHGLEWAVEDGSVRDAATFRTWLTDVLFHGAGRNDIILFAAAWRAIDADDLPALVEVAELAAAFQPTAERFLESTAQGRAFLGAVTASWPSPRLTEAATALGDGPLAYPVAVAIAAAAHGIPLAAAAPACLQAFAASLISAGVRAIPLGQTDGQRLLAGLLPTIAAIAGAALACTQDELGGAAIRADIASMKHETQYSRLFRS